MVGALFKGKKRWGGGVYMHEQQQQLEKPLNLLEGDNSYPTCIQFILYGALHGTLFLNVKEFKMWVAVETQESVTILQLSCDPVETVKHCNGLLRKSQFSGNSLISILHLKSI